MLVEIPAPDVQYFDEDEYYGIDPSAERKAIEALECHQASRNRPNLNAKPIDIEKLEQTLLRLNTAIQSLIKLKTLKEQL